MATVRPSQPSSESPTPTPILRADVQTFRPTTTFTPTGLTTPRVEIKAPCSFFLRGRCNKGASCRYEHGAATEGRRDPRASITCTFFQRGRCAKGDECPFSHDLGAAKPPPSTYVVDDASKTATSIVAVPGGDTSIWEIGFHPSSNLPTGPNVKSRALGGATVLFGDGADVSTISMPSDFSAVSMYNLPEFVSVQHILDLLARCGFPDLSPESIVLTRMLQTSRQIAQITVANKNFAGILLQRTGSSLKYFRTVIHIASVELESVSESGTNHLQLSNVACTWHKPSKVAYLNYVGDGVARDVLAKLNNSTRLLHGRKLNAIHQQSQLLQVRNLDVGTSRIALEQFLPQPAPHTISWGEPSHQMSSKELNDHVKASLETCGNLLEWVVSEQAGAPRVKAIAKFSDPEAARLAVKDLNQTLIDPSSNDMLLIVPIVSINMLISHRMLEAVQGQLDAFIVESCKSGYVAIKKYEDPGTYYTQIRVFGQSKVAVSRTKSSVEKLLSGHVAVDQAAPLSNKYFFRDTSTAFLKSVMVKHDITIIRDSRKMILRLYGAPSSIKTAQDALIAKASEVAIQSHTIVLDPAALSSALTGGFRLLVASLGKEKVKLDVTSNPKRIIIHGSEQQLIHAQSILHSYTALPLEAQAAALSIQGEEEELCPVCWTPAEEPIKTKCGHTYCSSCLTSQCTSASEADFPIRCLGASATCNQPFTLTELREALAVNDYETLLQTSFTGHIRSRPTQFQYCPTPDCDRFYRISSPTDPHIFDCDGCLSSICTACHYITHDGFTCTVYAAFLRAVNEHENEAFDEWKKQNDVRNCPKCKMGIEKVYGCHHMQCMACGTHICWACMKTFESGVETYGHMGKTHGDFGL